MEHINSVQKIAKKETREISVHENGLFFGLLHTHTHTQANWVYTKMAKRDKESDREKERKTEKKE